MESLCGREATKITWRCGCSWIAGYHRPNLHILKYCSTLLVAFAVGSKLNRGVGAHNVYANHGTYGCMSQLKDKAIMVRYLAEGHEE